MPDIICKTCKSENNYYTELKSNNLVAYCNICGAYIKNIPYTEPTFYFGKYKDTKVKDVTDLQYLKWVLEISDIKLSAAMRDSMQKRVYELEFLSK